MRRLSIHLCGSFLLAVAPVPAAIESFLPQDTHAAAWTNNLKQFREDGKKNPLVALMLDEKYGVGEGEGAVTRALGRIPISSVDPLAGLWELMIPSLDDGIRNAMDATTSVFNISANDVIETYDGGFGVFSTLYNLYTEDGLEVVEWDVVLVAEVGTEGREKSDEFLKKALLKVPEDARRTQVQYGGHDVYRINYYLDEEAPLPTDKSKGELGLLQEIPVIIEYTYLDNHLLLAEGRNQPLERALRAHRESSTTAALLTSNGWRSAQKALPSGANEKSDSDVFVYIDAAHHMTEWSDASSLRGLVRTSNALGLKGVGPLMIRGSVTETGAIIDAGIATPDEPLGVFQLLRSSPENAFTGLQYVPQDAMSFGSLSVNAGSAWDQFMAMMLLQNPSAKLTAEAMLAALEAQTKINLRRDILEGSNGELLTWARRTAATVDAPGAGSIAAGFMLPIGAGAESGEAVNLLLDKLSSEEMNLLDIESSEFLGHRIWETRRGPQTPADAPAIFLGVIPGYLLITSSGAEVRDAIRRFTSETPDNMQNNERVARVISKLPPEGVRGFVYTGARGVIEDLTRPRQRGSAVFPSASRLKEALGDTWWTLHSRSDSVQFSLVFDAPEQPAQ